MSRLFQGKRIFTYVVSFASGKNSQKREASLHMVLKNIKKERNSRVSISYTKLYILKFVHQHDDDMGMRSKILNMYTHGRPSSLITMFLRLFC